MPFGFSSPKVLGFFGGTHQHFCVRFQILVYNKQYQRMLKCSYFHIFILSYLAKLGYRSLPHQRYQKIGKKREKTGPNCGSMEVVCEMFNKKPPHLMWYLGMQWDYLNIMNTLQHMFSVKCFYNTERKGSAEIARVLAPQLMCRKKFSFKSHTSKICLGRSVASHPLPIRHNKMPGSSHQLKLHTDQPPFH